MLDGVTDTAWVGTGLAAGVWSFKGEALNGAGLGEASEMVTVPVAAALAA
jgi:hypothetical protein